MSLYFLQAQHVSGTTVPIIRSSRLWCWLQFDVSDSKGVHQTFWTEYDVYWTVHHCDNWRM